MDPQLTPEETLGRRDWIESLRIVSLSRVAFLAVATAAAWFLASGTMGPSQVGIADMWDQWDARHFAQIADIGYFDPFTDPHATAFFPGLPLLMRLVAVTGLTPILAGMIVSFVSSIVAGAYLHRFAEEDVGEGSGRRALLYLCLFPTAVFLVAPYSEALFLAGAVPAFYYARRNQWLMAAIPAAVAMGARLAGLFLLIGLFFEFVRQGDFSLKRVGRLAVVMVVGLVPLIAYCTYLAIETGDPFQFVQAQRDGWFRDLIGPVDSFLTTWRTWNASYDTNWVLSWRLEIIAAVVGLFFVAWALVRREWGYAAFMGSTLAVQMSSSWYFSIPRMLLSFFPAKLLLASFTQGKPRRHENLLMIMTPLATLGVVVYTQDVWFF